MRENNAENVINKSSGTEPNNEITRNRKRIRSDSESENSGRKMQKIDEGDENSDDDILSFAKKTLQQELPDSEDIVINIPTMNSGMYPFFKLLKNNKLVYLLRLLYIALRCQAKNYQNSFTYNIFKTYIVLEIVLYGRILGADIRPIFQVL